MASSCLTKAASVRQRNSLIKIVLSNNKQNSSTNNNNNNGDDDDDDDDADDDDEKNYGEENEDVIKMEFYEQTRGALRDL